MELPKLTQKYRGVRTVIMVDVLEGDGKDHPYDLKHYILAKTNSGDYQSFGSVSLLTQEEEAWFNDGV